ncbi:MAG: DUF937 domain-containing protein [Hyphomicrobiales bacterium]|nr:DUF937 domain-containing protein [Hyphomicrobiales bacterium]
MFNLNDIMQAAQGGQGIANLAQQFGISPEQAQAAVNSLIPALSQGLQSKLGDANGLGSIINAVSQPANQQAFNDPAAAAQSSAAAGANILGSLFGSPHITQQLAQAAAAQTGLRPDILASMLPVMTSMAMGGMFKSMQNQGMGNMLSQLANAAGSTGGMGNILSQVMNPAGAATDATPAGAAAGGMMAMLTNLFGGLFGNNAAGGAAPAALPGGLNPAMVQQGIDALGKMMQPGLQVAADHQANLANIMASMMKPQA